MKKNNLFMMAMVSIAVVAIYACGGKETQTPAEKPKTETPPTTASIGSINGEDIFKKTCIACHQANGEGIANTFPPLAKSDFLANRENVIHQVIKGKTGELVVNGTTYNNTMPPQALSDEEISAVLTYVYSSWGNSGGAVTVDEVKAVRATAQ